jgi:hypothetical protein
VGTQLCTSNIRVPGLLHPLKAGWLARVAAVTAGMQRRQQQGLSQRPKRKQPSRRSIKYLIALLKVPKGQP